MGAATYLDPTSIPERRFLQSRVDLVNNVHSSEEDDIKVSNDGFVKVFEFFCGADDGDKIGVERYYIDSFNSL